jgi:hypothetical protein|uniref:Uncharacterized protein n=1 Tax=Siphoviridae sp. ctmYS12 TaxID=2825652 RepID=A0A8S5P816_9CAUD|nr:MAG TPA: Protein of unknown function (DUF1128) [Siphoviridae sp. ctmYS12]
MKLSKNTRETVEFILGAIQAKLKAMEDEK